MQRDSILQITPVRVDQPEWPLSPSTKSINKNQRPSKEVSRTPQVVPEGETNMEKHQWKSEEMQLEGC